MWGQLWFVGNEIISNEYAKNMKKLWESSGSYLLNSTANPAHFQSNWAELAVLTGNSQTAPTIFFKFSGYIFLIISLRTHKTTIALTFLTHIISGTGGVGVCMEEFPKHFLGHIYI